MGKLISHPYELLERIEAALITRGYIDNPLGEPLVQTEYPAASAMFYVSESDETCINARNSNSSFVVKIDVPGVKKEELKAHFIPPHTIVLEGEHKCASPFAATVEMENDTEASAPHLVVEDFCIARMVKETLSLRQPNLDFAKVKLRHDDTGVVTIVVPKFHSDEEGSDYQHPRVSLKIEPVQE